MARLNTQIHETRPGRPRAGGRSDLSQSAQQPGGLPITSCHPPQKDAQSSSCSNMTTRAQARGLHSLDEPLRLSPEIDTLGLARLIEQTDLEAIRSSPSFETVLQLARSAITDRVRLIQASELQCSYDIHWVWEYVSKLAGQNTTHADQVQIWQEKLRKDLGREELDRCLRLGRETLQRTRNNNEKIRSNWGVLPDQMLDPKFQAKRGTSRNMLQGLAMLSDAVPLEKARTLLIQQMEARCEEEHAAKLQHKAGGKPRRGMILTLADIEGARSNAPKRRRSLTPSGRAKKVPRIGHGPQRTPTKNEPKREPDIEVAGETAPEGLSEVHHTNEDAEEQKDHARDTLGERQGVHGGGDQVEEQSTHLEAGKQAGQENRDNTAETDVRKEKQSGDNDEIETRSKGSENHEAGGVSEEVDGDQPRQDQLVDDEVDELSMMSVEVMRSAASAPEAPDGGNISEQSNLHINSSREATIIPSPQRPPSPVSPPFRARLKLSSPSLRVRQPNSLPSEKGDVLHDQPQQVPKDTLSQGLNDVHIETKKNLPRLSLDFKTSHADEDDSSGIGNINTPMYNGASAKTTLPSPDSSGVSVGEHDIQEEAEAKAPRKQEALPQQTSLPPLVGSSFAKTTKPLPVADLRGALDSLLPHEFLSSTAMELVLKYFKTQGSFIFDPAYYSLNSPRRIQVPKCAAAARHLLLPIHGAPKAHWTLALLDRDTRIVNYFYSLSQQPICPEIAASFIASIHIDGAEDSAVPEDSRQQWRFVQRSCPQQPNGRDCGVYVLVMAVIQMSNSASPVSNGDGFGADVSPSTSIDSGLWRRAFRDMLALGPMAHGAMAGDGRSHSLDNGDVHDFNKNKSQPEREAEDVEKEKEEAREKGEEQEEGEDNERISTRVDAALHRFEAKRTRREEACAGLKAPQLAADLFNQALTQIQVARQQAMAGHDTLTHDLGLLERMRTTLNELRRPGRGDTGQCLRRDIADVSAALQQEEANLQDLEWRERGLQAGRETTVRALEKVREASAAADEAFEKAAAQRSKLWEKVRMQQDEMQRLARRLAFNE